MNPLSALRWPFGRRAFLRASGAALMVPLGRATAAAAANDPATSLIWTSAFEGKRVWGYIDQHSVPSGDVFSLMLSTGPGRETIKGRIEFLRVGHYPPDGQRLIWTSPEITVGPQQVPITAAAAGVAWEPALDISTASWPAGYYSADFIHADTGERELQIAQLIVRSSRRGADILLKLSTNTYQAYNDWGGHSLYPSEEISKRGTIVTFDRPTAPAFFEYEVYLLRWLEEFAAEEGLTIDYASDFDVHLDPALLDHHALVISASHDEYWTKEMFDAFERRIFGQGKNVIFFGANAAYCQVRFADIDCPPDGVQRGRQLVCYKTARDPILRRGGDPLLAATWFRQDARRPESMLMGVAYQSWFQPNEDTRFPYRVASIDPRLFEGVGWQIGDPIADVVGYEWDNRDPDGDGHRLWKEDRSRNAFLPEDRLKVLFRGEPVDFSGRKGLAEAVLFQSAAGAKVFSAGSVRWAWGLGKPGFENENFRRFNSNLLRMFVDGSS